MTSFLKKILAVFLAFAVCGCVLSCKSGGSAGKDIYGILVSVCELFEGGKDKAILYSDATRKSENSDFEVIGGDKLGFFYDGKYEAPACFDKIRAYALRMPLDDSGFEVHIIECVNLTDADEVSALLMRRVTKMQGAEILEFAPEEYEICFRGATVCVFGRYVCLLSTPDNLACERLIKRMLR